MGLRFVEGFDDGAMFAKGWTNPWSANTAPVVGGGRFGGGALSCRYIYGGQFIFASPLAGTVTMGVAIRPDRNNQTGTICSFGIVRIKILPGGALGLYRSDNDAAVAVSGAAVWPSSNIWRYIETQIDLTTGVCKVRADGVEVVSGTLPVSTSINSVVFPNQPNGGVEFAIDDIYILDTTGTVNNNFLGDVRVQTLLPDADGSNVAMIPSTGTSHYNLVNEATPNTTNYVYTPTVGAKDSYQYQNLDGNTARVYGVQALAYARKDATGTINLRNITRIGSMDYSGKTTVPLSASWTIGKELWEQSPATSSSWSPNEVNDAEFGIETV